MNNYEDLQLGLTFGLLSGIEGVKSGGAEALSLNNLVANTFENEASEKLRQEYLSLLIKKLNISINDLAHSETAQEFHGFMYMQTMKATHTFRDAK